MNTLQMIGITALVAFVLGYATGHHQKTVSDNAKIVAQVEKVAKIDAKNDSDVEKQDDSDKLKIQQLEQDLAAARSNAAHHRVQPVTCVPRTETQEDASRGSEASASREPATGSRGNPDEVRGYEILRSRLLELGTQAEQLRIQVLACQAQWPR